MTSGGVHHDLDCDRHVGAPAWVDHERACARPGAQPRRDLAAVEHERRCGTARVAGPASAREQRSVRHPNGGEVQERAEMQREAGATRVVAAGGIYQEDVRSRVECADRGLKTWSLA
jgi:hypothetical protein